MGSMTKMKRVFDIYSLILGGIIIVGFITILGLLIFKDIKTANEGLLNIAIGGLMAQVGSIVGYFFGSSHGSRMKSEILENTNNTETNER